MNLHSIIIPHRNRNENLDLCVWSILRASEYGGGDFEVVIVDNSSKTPYVSPSYSWNIRVIQDETEMPLFNKPILSNRGIEEARGDVLTFLDADAIVGTQWLLGAGFLRLYPEIIRLCYRVRYLEDVPTVEDIAGHFHRYNSRDESGKPFYKLAWEAYGNPAWDNKDPSVGKVHGNSQFSITRANLGDLRFDPIFVGRGWEDLDMNARIWKHYGEKYQGSITFEPSRNMFHIRNNPNDWLDLEQNYKNLDEYNRRWRKELREIK